MSLKLLQPVSAPVFESLSRTSTGCLVVVGLILLLAPSTAAAREEPATAAELLRRWQQTTALTQRCAFQSEQLIGSPVDELGQHKTRVQVTRVWREADGRYKAVQTQWPAIAGEEVERRPERGHTMTTLLDPRGAPYQAYVLKDSAAKGKRRIELQVFRDLSYFSNFEFTQCAVLDGRIAAGEATADVLLENGELTVAPAREPVNGRPCHVVRATSPHGAMTLWIDPARGYGLARAEVRQGAGDKWGRVVLPTLIGISTAHGRERRTVAGVDTVVDSVTFSQVNGHWIADGARVRTIYLYEDEPSETYETTWKRTEIVLDPDFDELRAFEIDIPEGVPVVVPGAREVHHIWRKGKPVPAAEPEARDAWDKAVDAVAGSSSTQPSTQGTSQPAR